MGPLEPIRDLHALTDGWSTAVLITVMASVILVGWAVMLGGCNLAWVQEHPIALGIGSAVAAMVLTVVLSWIFEILLGASWPALPIALGLMVLCVLFLCRRDKARRRGD